jgi:alkylhydroperoxidase/carboxymuconolactone decarboxylase family protein YurZ/quercetin dioxygenase-like cupin family protein
MEKKQTAGREAIGDFAPEFAHLNDDILFGEVWSRTDVLSAKNRSFLTLAVLIAKGITDDSLTYHIKTAKANGITKKEMGEAITHIAFYAGWPNAWAAFRKAKEVYKEDGTAKEEPLFGLGMPNDGYAQYFTGKSYLQKVASENGLAVYSVTFEPGCRNFWHIHKAEKGGGQLLLCTDGRGYVQLEGKEPVLMTPGTAFAIPANAKHWHGAAKDSFFTHLSIEVPGEQASTEWLSPVEDKEYDAL